MSQPSLHPDAASIGGAVTFADRENIMFDFGVTEVQAARRRELIPEGDGRMRFADHGGPSRSSPWGSYPTGSRKAHWRESGGQWPRPLA